MSYVSLDIVLFRNISSEKFSLYYDTLDISAVNVIGSMRLDSLQICNLYKHSLQKWNLDYVSIGKIPVPSRKMVSENGENRHR